MLALLLFFLFTSLSASAEVHLITVGPGKELYTKFGHSALLITANGQSKAYDWGVFDNRNPDFYREFVLGILNYRVGAYSAQKYLNFYADGERQVIRNRVNLSARQEQALQSRIAQNLQPSQRTYAYNFFFDNCATRIRDHLDIVLGGHLSNSINKNKSNEYLREIVYRRMELVPLVQFTLDALMQYKDGSEISPWQHMFLPSALKDQLEKVRQVDDDGLPTKNLLLERSETIVPGNSSLQVSSTFGYQWLGYFIAGTLFLSWALRENRLSQVVFAGSMLFLSYSSFTLSLLMLGGHFFSGHYLLHQNPLLLLHWPTDILFAFPGAALLIGEKKSLGRGLRGLVSFHAVAFMALIVLQLFYLQDDHSRYLSSFGMATFLSWILLPTMLQDHQSNLSIDASLENRSPSL